MSGTVPFLFGLSAFLLAILAGAIEQGFIDPSMVEGLSATAVGVFAFLAAVAALGFYLHEENHRPRFGRGGFA